MTAARISEAETVQLDVAAARRAWVAPTVERIEAGSADFGNQTVADEGLSKS